MVFCVYIIYSRKLRRYYVGTTDDFKSRLSEHNTSRLYHEFTSRGIPWEEFYIFENLTSTVAYALEKKLKSMRSSKYFENLKKYPEMRERVLENVKQSLVQSR